MMPRFHFATASTLAAQSRSSFLSFTAHVWSWVHGLKSVMAVLWTGCGLNGEQQAPSRTRLTVGKGNFPSHWAHHEQAHPSLPIAVQQFHLEKACQLNLSCKLRLCSSEPHTSTARAQNWCFSRHNNPSVLPKFLQRAVYSYLYNKYRKLFPNIFNSVSEGLWSFLSVLPFLI